MLEQLVCHDPQALEAGGALRRLWIQHQEATRVGVPYFQQRDSAQRSQRDRSCFSSSCAMLLDALKTGTLPGSNSDDQYLAVVQRYGDTTDANAQLQPLAYYGVTARLVQDADFRLIEQQIARGIPVPCGYIHRGPVERPIGSGHWLGRRRPHAYPPGGERSLGGAGSGQRRHPQHQRDGAALLAAELWPALDGGGHRWWGLPLCPWEGLGGGVGWGWLRGEGMR